MEREEEGLPPYSFSLHTPPPFTLQKISFLHTPSTPLLPKHPLPSPCTPHLPHTSSINLNPPPSISILPPNLLSPTLPTLIWDLAPYGYDGFIQISITIHTYPYCVWILIYPFTNGIYPFTNATYPYLDMNRYLYIDI
jgi:hypothetical protein